MTVLRSREVVSTIEPKFPLKTLKNGAMEPTTPTKTTEQSNNLFDDAIPGSALWSDSSRSASGTGKRRSLRLASKRICDEITASVSISSRKRKVSSSETESPVDCVNIFDLGNVGSGLGGSDNRVLDSDVVITRKIEIEEMEMDVSGSVSVPEGDRVVKNLGESGPVLGLGSCEESFRLKKGKEKVKIGSCINGDSLGLELFEEGERDGICLSFRSGTKVLKRSVEGTTVDKFVHEKKRGNDDESAHEDATLKGRRRLSREEKGKVKWAGETLTTDGVNPVKSKSAIDAVSDDEQSIEGVRPKELDKVPSADNNDVNQFVSRLSREEKGKAKVLDDELRKSDAVKMDLVPEAENHAENRVLGEESASARDGGKDLKTDRMVVNPPRKRGYRERFRDIARQNAARFAHFSHEDEEGEQVVDVAEGEMPQPEADGIVEEDWPGPFSTAMKIIKDRALNVNAKQPCASVDKNGHASISWVPKKNEERVCSRHLIPSLQDMCMEILAKNADCITSLESVPDVMRHKLSHLLCDSRKMESHFFDLLVRGSPTEIRIRDCSWLSEDQFTKTFEGCDMTNLTVLQLDQCGRCMPDYILTSTLARFSGSLPVLTTLSLKGACRLSDIGLNTLVSSAPALRSINLGQCSLLTSEGINNLADSLGSVLKELYLDDCQSVDAMLVLPGLSKLKHLEVLSVAGIETVCDDFICEFLASCGGNIKELVLADCVKLSDCSLKAIGETCWGLCAIDLSNLSKLTDSAVGFLANGCRAIHTLKLCRNAFSDEAIAAFLETCGESLQELSLNNVNKVAYNTAVSITRCSRNLESLDLSWCRNLTNEALGLIADSCLSLKVLKLFGCTQVTSVFLDGHSNPNVQIVGLKMTPILEHLKVPNPLEGPLHYSAVSSSS